MGSRTRNFANNVNANGRPINVDVAEFDDNKLVNDLSTLGLRVHTQENLVASNTNSQYVDVFQDSTGITSLTDCQRDDSEYISSVVNNIPSTLKILINGDDTNCKDIISNQNASFGGSGAGQDTSTKKWGTGSVKLPSGGYARYDNHLNAASIVQDENYCWDAWIYHDDTYGTEAPIFTVGRWNYAGHNNTLMCRIDEHAESKVTYSYYDGTSSQYYLTTAANAIPDNEWFHMAIARQGTSHYLWVNGSQVSWASTSGSATRHPISFSDASYGFNLGRSDQQNQDFDGWVDDFRWYKGTNIWGTNSSITVPTGPQSLNAVSATGNFQCNTITAGSATTKMGAVITYEDNAGTNALNTDIVLQLSADNGSNFSTATLTALPDFSSGIKCAKVNDLAVTSGTQLKYKISFANQASGSKEARIRGVSLNY